MFTLVVYLTTVSATVLPKQRSAKGRLGFSEKRETKMLRYRKQIPNKPRNIAKIIVRQLARLM
jgi:hypothetical protein